MAETATKPMSEPTNKLTWLNQVRDDAKYITMKRIRDQQEEQERKAYKAGLEAKKGAK